MYAQNLQNVCAKFTKCKRRIHKIVCAKWFDNSLSENFGHLVTSDPRDRFSVCDAAWPVVEQTELKCLKIGFIALKWAREYILLP